VKERFFLFILILPAFCLAQTREVDSLKQIITRLRPDTAKVNAMLNVVKAYKFNDPDSALRYGRSALALAQKLAWPEGIGKADFSLASIFLDKGEYAEALDHYTRAKKIWETDSLWPRSKHTRIKKHLAKTFNGIGIVYDEQAHFPKALNYYLRALKIFEETGETKGIAAQLCNIGLLYSNQHADSLAEYYYRKALPLSKSSGYIVGEANIYGNLGILYQRKGNLEKIAARKDSLLELAIGFFKTTCAVKEKLGDLQGMGNQYANMGTSYFYKQDLASALTYFFKALNIAEDQSDKFRTANVSNNLAGVYKQLKKYDLAGKYLQKALALYEEMGVMDGICESEKMYSEIENLQGNPEKALMHFKRFVTTRDSISSDENIRSQTRMAMEYEFDKKIIADSTRSAENKKFESLKHEKEIAKQRTLAYSGIIAFSIMLILAGISYYAYRNRKKANQEIARQKALVEEKQKEVLDSIYYARRIQRALLTSETYIQRHLKKWMR